jgi:carbon storage regulator
MLVLSRRLNETIVIAGRVRVTVLAITPSRIELGVEAPLQVTVDREEIHLRRQLAPAAVAEQRGEEPAPSKPKPPRRNRTLMRLRGV